MFPYHDTVSLLKLVCNIEDQLLGLFPSEAEVGDGFAENMFLRLTSAVLDVALDHESLYKALDVTVLVAAVNVLVFICHSGADEP